MLPFIYLITNNLAFNPLALIGAFVSIFGIYLEIHSDIAMHHFQKIRQSKGEIINVGLWKHSRHPNYLGEILFWWGLFFIAVALAPSLYWTGVGAIANNLMFVFISVPMAENHMATYKNDFATYKNKPVCCCRYQEKADNMLSLEDNKANIIEAFKKLLKTKNIEVTLEYSK